MNKITYIATEVPALDNRPYRAPEIRFSDGRKVLLADHADDAKATDALRAIDPAGPRIFLHRTGGIVDGIHMRTDGKAPPSKWWLPAKGVA